MGAVRRFADKILLFDLFAGLGITFRNMWKKKVTVQYPEERKEPAHRFRGMFRLDEDRCIKCTLCARDCPIDIIYIDSDGGIVSIAENTKPYSEQSIPSEGSARYVLEVNGGFCQRHGVAVGTRVELPAELADDS